MASAEQVLCKVGWLVLKQVNGLVRRELPGFVGTTWWFECFVADKGEQVHRGATGCGGYRHAGLCEKVSVGGGGRLIVDIQNVNF